MRVFTPNKGKDLKMRWQRKRIQKVQLFNTFAALDNEDTRNKYKEPKEAQNQSCKARIESTFERANNPGYDKQTGTGLTG